MAADYSFYTQQYKGNALTETEFNRLLPRSLAYIKMITSGSADDSDAVKMATCAVVEETKKQEQPELASQTVDNWTKTFRAPDKSGTRRLYDAARLYLSGTGLLYRGV